MRRVGFGLWLVLALLVPTAARTDDAWTPGPNASGDNTFAGAIDTPASGATIAPNGQLTIQGWAVDRTASGWSGIDDVSVYLGLQDQGGALMNHAAIGLPRNDVAAALGNPYFAASGFSASFSVQSLGVGPNTLTVYLHTPGRGSWYRQLQVVVPAAPARAYADDPLLVVSTVSPSLDVSHTLNNMVLTGYAIDRNMPDSLQLGAGGSGVSSVQAYLDGPRATGGAAVGTLLATAAQDQKDREATGFGDRFLMAGFVLTIHPSDLSVDRHELYIYADSAYWPNETLVVVPFNVT